MPKSSEVVNYMSAIKAQVDELELQERAYVEAALNAKKTEECKAEEPEQDALNDSSLSGCSQMNNDDDTIMKDLEDIASDLYADEGFHGSNEFNIGTPSNFDDFSNDHDIEFDNIHDYKLSSKEVPEVGDDEIIY